MDGKVAQYTAEMTSKASLEHRLRTIGPDLHQNVRLVVDPYLYIQYSSRCMFTRRKKAVNDHVNHRPPTHQTTQAVFSTAFLPHSCTTSRHVATAH